MATPNKPRSKFFRVASEGDTIDGREISAQQIQEMADSYDPNRYAARVWTEHFRSLFPDGAFAAQGDVVAAKAEKITDAGELNGKLGLYVQVEAHPSLLAMQAAGQKLYHSIEMLSNFAKTGKAYLVGLATTDSPASQGTQVMAFGDEAGDLVAGAPHEAAIEFDEPEDNKPSLLSRVTGMLKKNKGDNDARFADTDQAIEAVAEEVADLDAKFAKLDTVPRADFDALKTAHDKTAADLAALTEKLSQTAAPGGETAPATGGDGQPKAVW